MPQPESADRENLLRHLRALSRPRDAFENSLELAEAQAYIQRELEACGLAVEKQTFHLEEDPFENLIAAYHPPGAIAAPWIIGAHFDTVPASPGADDNASGVAALLETAQLITRAKPRVCVRFVAFNLEEYGMVGSTHYVNSLRKEKILGMLSLEMVGYTSQAKGSQKLPALLKPFYPDTGNFLALVGDSGSSRLLSQAKKAFEAVPAHTLTVPMHGTVFPEVRLSDHAPFWDAGYPALLVTDTSFFRNPHYHAPEDTIETLDLDFMARVTDGVVRMIVSEEK